LKQQKKRVDRKTRARGERIFQSYGDQTTLSALSALSGVDFVENFSAPTLSAP
jgi:hypothetical protein